MIKMKKSLSKLILKHDDSYLLLKKSSFVETSDYSGVWETPGGKIEEQENAEQAMLREIFEEININISDLSLLHVFSNSSFSEISVFFKDLNEKPSVVISDEHIDYDWFTEKEIQELDSVIYKDFLLELINKSKSLI